MSEQDRKWGAAPKILCCFKHQSSGSTRRKKKKKNLKKTVRKGRIVLDGQLPFSPLTVLRVGRVGTPHWLMGAWRHNSKPPCTNLLICQRER